MKANVEENTILIMCPKIQGYITKCKKILFFDFHFKYFQIKITSSTKNYTKLNHCITYRVPVCNLSDGVTEPTKSYGNHMKANFSENTIIMCQKITGLHHHTMQKNVILLITI